MQYYSQFGQDQYLYENFFQGKADGVFVDIGAHDGITGSNTYFFELLRWQGICFEPIPEVYAKLKENRKCILRPWAISDRRGNAKFTVIKGYSEMLSGLTELQSADHVSRINREVAEYNQTIELIDVETRCFYPTVPYLNIDILSIDVEGAEERIIRSIPFDIYDISFMTIEFNQPNDDLYEYLYSKGYTCINQLGVDKIFKKR